MKYICIISLKNAWKRSIDAKESKANACLKKDDFDRFQFPPFPLETQSMEMQRKTSEALILLALSIRFTFPVSKTDFQSKPLFFNRFQFPVIIYKYIYEGIHLHIYLNFKAGFGNRRYKRPGTTKAKIPKFYHFLNPHFEDNQTFNPNQRRSA